MPTAHRLIDSLAPLPQRCLVGVSGGIDSVALLHALVSTGHRPIVLHFDHGWRQDSAQDAAFVRKLAKNVGLQFILGKAPARLKKTEQSARQARWAFFQKAAKRTGLNDLVLAHNADDQVETFLLQLLRGGGSGIRGMRSTNMLYSLVIHRPWLRVWRQEILDYSLKNAITWREDSTNVDTALLRNRLRHKLLPYLKEHFSKDAPEALWRAAEILGAESEWLDSIIADSSVDTRAERLRLKTLNGLPVAQTRRILRNWLHARGITDLSFDHIEAVRGLITHRFPAKVNLPKGRHARRQSGFLFVI
jgi:tRNA(Ile)-lysidine synthase